MVKCMEDEKTKVNDNSNNINENTNSSKPSSDNDKYKSRKGSSKDNNTKKSVPNRNNTFNKIRKGVKTAAFNKAASTIPGVSTLNNLNNIRKGIGGVVNRRRNTAVGSSDTNTEVSDNGNDEEVTSNSTALSNDNPEETNEGASFNPLKSIFGSKNSFMGRFSFWGRLSLPLKIIIIVGPALLALFLLIIILAIPLGAHSSLLSLDTGIKSNSTGNIDYGDYVLDSTGHEILHQQLSSFLQSQGTSLEEFNALIASNVEEAGYHTRAGVVSAAVTLIAELGNKYGVKIPYFWGGGHGSIVTGADGNWGNNSCRAAANGVFYNYCGLDCSGFVTWALNNGGFSTSPLVTGSFQNLPGAQRVALTDSAVLQPGDLLESSGHVVLVVGVEGSQYVCAEASGNMTGVLFTRRNFNISNYWGVKMDGYYGLTG